MVHLIFDVAIVGGGPAGCAAALTLRRHAPELTVVVVEGSDYTAPRLGETLPPLGRQLLGQLGAIEDFETFARAGGARPVHGMSIQWNSSRPMDVPYLYRGRGSGWHLDRAAFDGFLAGLCEQCGVRVLRSTRVRDVGTDVGSDRPGWRIDFGECGTAGLQCRFVIDASGRGSVARQLGARSFVRDRLAAYARYFRGEESDPGLTVESFEHGWWYAAGLPGNRAVAVCLTDGDLGRELRLHDTDGWLATIEFGEAIRRRLGSLDDDGEPPLVRNTISRVLDPPAGIGDHGAGWLAAGDAASVFDPLSSQGIVKALRSGIFAAYAVCDHLQGDHRWMPRYRRFVADEYRTYLETRARVYAEENRWPASPFWRRRRSPSSSRGHQPNR